MIQITDAELLHYNVTKLQFEVPHKAVVYTVLLGYMV